MKLRNVLMVAAFLCAASGWAQVSNDKKEWAEGGVQFLMTPQEKAEWSQLKSDADADKFIKLFWLRRDPSPGTPANEVRQEIEARIKYADEHFTYKKTKGSLTDRGKVLILFGVPTRVQRSGGQGQSTIASPLRSGETSGSSTQDENAEKQAWIYDSEKAQKLFAQPKVEIDFMDRFNTGDLRMTAPRFDFNGAQERAAQLMLMMPNLTIADVDKPIVPPPPPAPVAPPPPAAVSTASTALKTATLETAVADAKAGKGQAKGAVIAYAELVAPTGDGYVPLELYIPKSAGVTSDAADTFFVTVDDANGKRVAAVEEPAKLVATKNDIVADTTLTLPSGKYNVVAGVAKAGAPVVIATASIEVTGVVKDAVGTSKLILSNNIFELTEAAPPKAPFAFGKLKVVPKADLAFTNQDDLWYFVEVNNPGIDTASNMPKLQLGIDLLAAGKPVARLPLSEAPAAPLSGVTGPGHYAVWDSIPLPKMSTPLKPGDYTLKLKIVDTVTKQSYTVEQSFKITG